MLFYVQEVHEHVSVGRLLHPDTQHWSPKARNASAARRVFARRFPPRILLCRHAGEKSGKFPVEMSHRVHTYK